MLKSESNEIIKAIKAALKEDEPEVRYFPPTSDGQCGYFQVTTHGNLSMDEIAICLRAVIKEYCLDIDQDSYGTFDLNAYWDKKDKK